MIRGTTPTFTFTIKNDAVDLTTALTIIACIKQSGKKIEKTGDNISVTAKTVSLWLTQQESLKLTPGVTASVQINWTYPNPNGGSPLRAATKPKTFMIDEQFIERVIE